MNVLWLSWRDIKNPTSGGAEKVTIEVASRLVQNGNDVTLFTSSFKNSKSEESIRGVKIIRRGNLLTCRLFAFLYYLKNKNFDAVIDEINTIPFFSVLYAPQKSSPLVHQLAKEYWFANTPWPISKIGYFLEPHYLKLYKNRPTLVLSNSTKVDLQKLGFNNLQIYRVGLDFKPAQPAKKENLILFIGRLTFAKNPNDAIYAFSLIQKSLPGTKFAVIGAGTQKMTASLVKLSQKLGVKNVSFTGFVSLPKKADYLKKAKVILIPSIREGWGLVATEAQATYTIPIAYNVCGLKDSIRNNKTGILTQNDPNSLARATIRILKNERLRKRLALDGYKFSQSFSWENSYSDFSSYLQKSHGKTTSKAHQ